MRPVATLQFGQSNWKDLLEAAVCETDQENLTRRILEARDAIMDEIEDSFHTASSSERQALISAMNAVRDLETKSAGPALDQSRAAA
jgi:hypothetical protein